MNALRKHILVAVAVLGMGGAAVAVQAQVPPEGRHGHAASQATRAEHFAKRQAKLHDALKLTAAQEPAWTAYQAAIKPADMGAHSDRAAWAALPAPQRLEKAIAMAKQHTAAMESHLGPLNTFYAVLTPEQKKVFDASTKGGEHGEHDGHGMKSMKGMKDTQH